jgi:hypothetical protein
MRQEVTTPPQTVQHVRGKRHLPRLREGNDRYLVWRMFPHVGWIQVPLMLQGMSCSR